MKKVTRGFLRITMVFCAIVAFIYASATNPTITINYNVSGLTPGTPITVPLVIDAPSNLIGGFDLDINYNTDVLTYTSTNGQFIDLLLNGNFGSTFVNQPTYKIRVTWSETSAPVTLLNQVICNLHFTYNGGATPLTLVLSGTLNNPGNSYIIDQDLVTFLSATWNNGSASGSGIDIHSTAGGGTWSTASKWDLGVVPNATNNAFITLSNPITITTNVQCNNLTINSGGQLTLNASDSLKVNGNCSILDNGTNGSGSYVDFGTTTFGGTCSVQRYMNGNWTSGPPTGSTIFHYIASPVTGGIINTFFGDLLNQYNEPLQQWDSLVLPLSTPLVVGKGYAAAPHTPGGIRTFGGGGGGALNTGNLTISALSFTAGGNASYRGYNLIGNLYPSALLWDATWSRTNVDGSAWLWDPAVSHYWTNDGTTGTGPFVNGIIPPEQGFFVHVTALGTGSITIPNAKRQHSTQAYYKQDIPDLINLKLEGNNGYDEALIFFNSNATTGYDNEFDTYKLFSGSPVTEIYSVIEENTDASINVLPDFQGSTVIPVGIKTGATGTYIITASKLESFPGGTSIYLEDKVTGQTVKLNDNPVYSFTSDAVNTVRFNLHFSPVGIPEIASGKINFYSKLKDVYVNIPTSMHGNIVIYNLLGSEVANQVIQGNTLNRISLNSCPTGYYIVKVIGDGGITAGKVFIQ